MRALDGGGGVPDGDVKIIVPVFPPGANLNSKRRFSPSPPTSPLGPNSNLKGMLLIAVCERESSEYVTPATGSLIKIVCIGSCPVPSTPSPFSVCSRRVRPSPSINRAAELVDDAIAVGQHLNVLRHGFGRVRSILDDLAFKALRCDEQKITIRR